jgi:hypothetical protein
MQYTSSVGLAAKRGKGHSLCLAWKVLRLLGFKPVVAIPPSLRSAGGNTGGVSESDVTVPLRLGISARHAIVISKAIAAIPLKLCTATRETQGWNQCSFSLAKAGSFELRLYQCASALVSCSTVSNERCFRGKSREEKESPKSKGTLPMGMALEPKITLKSIL